MTVCLDHAKSEGVDKVQPKEVESCLDVNI